MKKIVLLCFLLMGVVGCIEKFLVERPYSLYFQEEHITISPKKLVYKIGDTISLKIIFPKYLVSENSFKKELKPDKQNLIAFLNKSEYADSIEILRDDLLIFQDDNDMRELNFNNKGNDISLTNSIKIIFKKEREYELRKLLLINVLINYYQSVGYKGNKTFKVEP